VKEKSAQINLRESKILARANRSQEGRPATASGREEERPDGKIAEERGPESSESISKEVFAKYQTPVQQAAVRQPPIIVSAVTETHESHIPKPAPTKVVFSGIQPTGIPHLGNYLGALRGWTKLQDEADANTRLIFSLVDLHAVTIQQDPKQLRQWRRESFAMLAAIGLDIQKSTIFHQSDVPAHSELMWILSCQASMGYLGRMTQWKDKTQNEAADSGKLKLGLFSYPVLQAADILVHGTTHVPVGEDQSQHLEFARELANGFNHLAKKPILIPPTTIISPAKRVRSLTDPSLKMSKSFPNPKSRILLTDDEATIGAKIRSAVTDSQTGVTYDPDTRPGVSNLVDLLYYADPEFQPVEDEHAAKVALAADIQNLSMKDFKTRVADVLDAMICPIRERYAAAMAKSKEEVETDAQVGAAKARQSADVVLKKVKRAIGLC
jgi:tryptophanyl-tRNA synthetase